MHLWSTWCIDMMEDPLKISSERSYLSSPRRDSVLSVMSAWELAQHCRREISPYRRGDPSSEQEAWAREGNVLALSGTSCRRVAGDRFLTRIEEKYDTSDYCR